MKLFSVSPSFQGRHYTCGVHHLPQRELVFTLPGVAGHRYHVLSAASAHRLTAGTRTLNKHTPDQRYWTLALIGLGLDLAHSTQLLSNLRSVCCWDAG